MVPEQGLDLLTVELELLAQGAQQFSQADSQLALGPHNRLGSFELVGLGEELEPLFDRLGPPELVGVQELLPSPFASLNQCLRRWESQDELPGEGISPVVKGFQRRWIIFQQGLLELVDHR